MKILVPILIILVLWVGVFILAEKILKKTAQKQRINRIKDILFDHGHYEIVKIDNKEKLLIDNTLYEL
jgi:hypothetical protein